MEIQLQKENKFKEHIFSYTFNYFIFLKFVVLYTETREYESFIHLLCVGNFYNRSCCAAIIY